MSQTQGEIREKIIAVEKLKEKLPRIYLFVLVGLLLRSMFFLMVYSGSDVIRDLSLPIYLFSWIAISSFIGDWKKTKILFNRKVKAILYDFFMGSLSLFILSLFFKIQVVFWIDFTFWFVGTSFCLLFCSLFIRKLPKYEAALSVRCALDSLRVSSYLNSLKCETGQK